MSAAAVGGRSRDRSGVGSRTVRILAFSDLHRDERAGRSLVERSPQVDVVAGVGDFASMHRGLRSMIDVLSAIDRPVLLVPGNNETDDALRAACAGWPAARVLHGEATKIDDMTFFGLGGGVPVTPWVWSFDLTEQQAERMLTAIAGSCAAGALATEGTRRRPQRASRRLYRDARSRAREEGRSHASRRRGGPPRSHRSGPA
jgi:predicted phosphodiesterase